MLFTFDIFKLSVLKAKRCEFENFKFGILNLEFSNQTFLKLIVIKLRTILKLQVLNLSYFLRKVFKTKHFSDLKPIFLKLRSFYF